MSISYNKANSALKGGLGGAETKVLLIAEAKRLKGIIKKVWGQYEASYSPSQYIRTGKTAKSLNMIDVTPVFVIDPIIGILGIRLNFPNDLYHMSIVHDSQPKGHSFMLISQGWHSKKLESKIGEKHRFTYYEGFNLIGKITDEYNATKPIGHLITLEFEWKGKGNFTK